MKYGVSVNVDGLGYLKATAKRDLHSAKSKAGKAFHAENVKSVCVYAEDGTAKLYLKKTPNGVYREEN